MVSDRKISWGVVGCGWVARDFMIPAINLASNAELFAVCDRNPEAVTGFPSLSLEELLESGIDAVYIATPNDSHAMLTARAAAAGIHVLCEKPMATNLSDAECMVQACAAAGVTYATAFDQRFHPAHMAIRELIGNGVLGKVTCAHVHYACWLPAEWSADNWRIEPRRAGGGSFIDLAPHGVDLLQYLTGCDLLRLQCFKQRRVFNYSVDDGAVAIGEMDDGCLCTLQVAYNRPDNFARRTLEIYGTEAMIVARNTMGQTPGGEVEVISRDGKSERIIFDESLSPFLSQVEVFSQCLLDGTRFPFTPQNDLQTMKVLSTCL